MHLQIPKMNALCVLFMCASLSTSWYSLLLCCHCCWLVPCYCPYCSAPSCGSIQTLWSRSQLQSRTKQSEQSENHSRNCCGCNFTRARSSSKITRENDCIFLKLICSVPFTLILFHDFKTFSKNREINMKTPAYLTLLLCYSFRSWFPMQLMVFVLGARIAAPTKSLSDSCIGCSDPRC